MKKLITLTNFKTGITKNIVTGEVRKVDAADEKKRIELLAKNTAELYNAGVKNLLKKEEEKRKCFMCGGKFKSGDNLVACITKKGLNKIICEGCYSGLEKKINYV